MTPNDGSSLAGLSATEKRILLARLLQEEQQQKTVFPLSHGQRGMWSAFQFDPHNTAYNTALPSRIRSCLNVPAFGRVMQTLVDRHPSLRTTFAEEDGELRQRVQKDAPVAFQVIDAAAWSEEELQARLEDAVHQPFDLRTGPLLRTWLFSRAADDHVFLAVAHHIVLDFWSLIVLLQEVGELYPEACAGRTPSPPPLTADYSDFVRWQADMLASPEGARLGAYWQQQLEDVPHDLELPTDRLRPPAFNPQAGVAPFGISAELTERLQVLANEAQTTLFSVLLAGFQTLLGHYSGQQSFVVGSPFSGRSQPGFEETVGYFVNLLPLRADLDGDPTFRELVRRVGQTVLEGLEHQEYPFLLMLDDLHVPRDRSRPPLIQVSFVLEKSHRQTETGRAQFLFPEASAQRVIGGLLSESFYVEQRTCQHEIELILEQSGGAFRGMLRYCSALFERATIEQMASRLETLLASAAAEPERRLSELSWFAEAERQQVLSDWNRTEVAFPRDVCLHEMFARQVQRTPDAPAVRCGSRRLSYGELDARSNRLAQRLQELGGGPGTLIALCCERSVEMLVAMLATLKTGAACVPLDPDNPPERMRRMLADTRACALLTQPALIDRLPHVSPPIVDLDDQQDTSSTPQDVHPLPQRVSPRDLAYVIYTSGSTGEPKGVMVEHRAICNTIQWRHRDLPVSIDDRVLLLLPGFFDAAWGIIFSTLTQGAELLLAEPHAELNPTAIAEQIAELDVTVLPATPPLLRLLSNEPGFSGCRGLRMVYAGGESMPVELPSLFSRQLDVTFCNLYGPTETAVEATWWTCRPGDSRNTIPIGRPISNVRTYVLDRGRQPLPVGIPGELYIGGAGVARGYLNEPRLTAERFLADPFTRDPGARMYRTGDRCRWLADGSLEFLGRLDEQIKVRGRRVELGEVESALARHPAVQAVAATMYDAPAGESQLVAYFVPKQDASEVEEDQLRRYLEEQLPAYMVPVAMVRLSELPRTASGKLDRRALPRPRRSRTGPKRPVVAPRTTLEQFLADLWQQVLPLERIGVYDRFYELGGSSLQAAIVASRLQNSLSQRIQTAALFDCQDIASLACHLAETYPDLVRQRFGPSDVPERGTTASNGRSIGGIESEAATPSASPVADLLVPLQPDGDRRPLFMVHPPGGIVVCYQPLAQQLGEDQPLYGIRARGLHGEAELPSRLEDMAAEYVTAIRRVQTAGPYVLGGWSLGGIVALEMAQQLHAAGEGVGSLMFLDTTIPFGPANRDYTSESDSAGEEYGLDLSLEELGDLDAGEQLPYLWEHTRKLGLIDDDTPQQLVWQIIDDLKGLFHNHVRLASEYAVQPYRGQITLFRPLDAPVAADTPPDRGWGQLADRVEVHFVPGLHHTMVKQPHVQVLAREVRACLDRVGDVRW